MIMKKKKCNEKKNDAKKKVEKIPKIHEKIAVKKRTNLILDEKKLVDELANEVLERHISSMAEKKKVTPIEKVKKNKAITKRKKEQLKNEKLKIRVKALGRARVQQGIEKAKETQFKKVIERNNFMKKSSE